ncbi:leucine-rich repeat-containing protein 71-like isoform X6 [Mercenaria mercenaria]|uniref:leucine-rich repeat-containing protein 71-like isoform X6 n=1 Tax=Mercenaria mercenaria TaxID=6596 RepID=UPI00234E79AB|nr:leucine-rich repeat-containing protein 71-like isoform X6 [Mercenaria mercenaria]
MPRSIRSARSNSICSVTSESGRGAKLDELLASRVKMGKKVEKGLNKEKNQSATSQDELDSNKALEPHVCTGNFSADFSELCRRNNMTFIPPVIMRPRPPAPVVQQEVSPAKGGKDKGKPSVTQPEPEQEENAEDGEPVDAPPKTFTTKDKFEYFKPSIQVEMDNQDKPDTVNEIFIRGWKVDTVMMDIFKQCWPTMEKLHSINLWNTGLNDDTLHTLSTILPQCPNIKNVTLDGNATEKEDWFELITEESPVQNLSLRHCGITNKGAKMIGRCLGSAKRANTKLLTLNLSNNKIGEEGLEEIAQGLRLNRTLLSLSLASNEIRDKGVVKLSEVLSRFPLTHEEVVERRKLMSDRSSPDRNKSPPLSRRADSKDRPGSVRSSTHQDKGGKKNEKPSAKAKKDGKGGKEEKEEKHEKTKGKKEKEDKAGAKKAAAESQARRGVGANVGGRSSGADMQNGNTSRRASLAADAKGKGNKTKGKEKGGKPAQEQEPADSQDFINPLLEGADYIDGRLWVAGNRVLINLNLSRNEIGETGLEALLKAMQYQTTLCMENKSSGTGLMRLLVGKNKVRSSHELLQKITDIMLPKDPFYKPPPQTPEVNEA